MALQIDKSEQMQRLEVFGLVFQNRPAKPFRPVKVALLKTTICLPPQAGQIGHRCQ
jgi:hypothetical protein